MNVTIFKDVTTEEKLKAITENAASDGLYMDMEDDDQRRYVKERSAEITDIIKLGNRARIDRINIDTKNTNSEWGEIEKILLAAVKPYALLIQGHAEKRKKILDAKKASKLAVEAAAQKLADHEFGILTNEKFDRDLYDAKAKSEAERIENELRIASEAKIEAETLAKKTIDDANTARQQAIDDKAKADKDLLESEARTKLLKEQAEQQRLNNEWLAYINEAYETNSKIDQSKLAAIAAKQAALDAVEREKSKVAHAAAVEAAAVEARRKDEVNNRLIHRAIYGGFIDAGLSKEEATKATQAIIDSAIPHITINY